MLRNLIKIALLLPLTLVVAESPAAAHTSVVATNPTYKSTLSVMPPEISIEFTDELMVLGDAKVNSISVSKPDGSSLYTDAAKVLKNKLSISIPESDYADGTYIVSYRVVSADGHVVSGSYDLYLNQPSGVSKSVVEESEHHGFFHLHRNHLIEAGVVLILIILWWAYRRFAGEQGE